MHRLRSLAAAALAATALLGASARPTTAAAPIKLNLGVLKIAALADVYAAQKLGYFEKEGLEVTLTTANNGNDP